MDLPVGGLFEAAFQHLHNPMVITDADFDGGPFVYRCNQAFCTMTGYTEEEWRGRSPRILQGPDTDPAVIERLRRAIRAHTLFEGRTVNYRKDGTPYVVQWNISPVRDDRGEVVAYISVQQDVTALAEAQARNRALAQEVERQADRLASEMRSAAQYTTSILPKGLTGRVKVSSHYLPAQELGGDTFDYRWIDEDHLLVYLLDVSGHGLRSALLAVSLHNMLRSSSVSLETLLNPDAVLTQLNGLFQMEQQADQYFTMWYGVYQASTRVLRYASAGAPSALMFEPATGADVLMSELPANAPPIGLFADTEFASHTRDIPSGCRMLLYSDGASDITLRDDQPLLRTEFLNLVRRVAAAPAWTLDDLIGELKALSPSDVLEDDCSVILLTFE